MTERASAHRGRIGSLAGGARRAPPTSTTCAPYDLGTPWKPMRSAPAFMRSILAFGPRLAAMKGSFVMASLWSRARSAGPTSPQAPVLLLVGMR